MIRILAVLAFLLSLGSLAGNYFFFQRVLESEQTRAELEAKLVQLEERNTELESLEAKVSKFQEESGRLQAQVKDYSSQRDTLKNELDEALEQTGELRKQLKMLETERGQLVQAANLDDVAEKAIAQEASKLPAVTIPAPAPEPKKGKAKGEPAKAASAVPADEDPRPSQVLTVNRQYKFVVVNLGLRDKLKIGDKLRVEQAGKLAGRVQVDKLYENFSSCTILEENAPAEIKEGDMVRVG